MQQQPGLRTDGDNVFLYHHPANQQSPMDVDFGVQVTRPFDRAGEVFSTETPAGKVTAAIHIGPTSGWVTLIKRSMAWATANKISFAGKSWEVYGDWPEDTAKLETRIEYLLS